MGAGNPPVVEPKWFINLGLIVFASIVCFSVAETDLSRDIIVMCASAGVFKWYFDHSVYLYPDTDDQLRLARNLTALWFFIPTHWPLVFGIFTLSCAYNVMRRAFDSKTQLYRAALAFITN